MSLFSQSSSATPDFIHAHCDGGSRGNPGPSGFGAVVTDGQGRTLAELSGFLGTRTNNYAEYSGLLAVLDWAIENGHRNLKVVSDSELMVKQIQGKYKVNSPDLKPLWQEARNRIAQLDNFEIAHALRHKNKEADALANQAMDRGTKIGPDRGTKTGPDLSPRRVVEKFTRDSSIDPIFLPRVEAAAPRSVAVAGRQPTPQQALEPREPSARPTAPIMLRGFTKDGSIHLLGGAALPDGIFVKIIRE